MFEKLNKKLASKKFRKKRKKINVLTFEEVMWMVAGFGVGVYVGLGLIWFMLLLPLAIIGAYAYEIYQYKKYGHQKYHKPRNKKKKR